MRRLVAIALLVPAVAVLVAIGLGANGSGDAGYKVRAVFDNVAFAVPGEDVKIAGAKVGVIESMDVTDDNKAAVTLRIDDERFTPFKDDAECTVRPQSLIGEKFVECKAGTPGAGELDEIREGDGEGEHLLPLARTSSPVDLDMVNNVMRLPYRERLAIILNEFGTALAGRGKELNRVIHRANPALRETDKVLRILARQNRVLARLAVDSDTALAPLAREKSRVSDFIVQANATAEATAERRADIRGSIARLPRFLTELRGLMGDLEGLTDQATPVTRDLHDAAPDISRLIIALGPFSQAARPAIRSLGRALVRGRPALIRSRPLIQDLGTFASNARPVSTNLDRLARSLDRTGGIERLMDYLFFQMIAINGFDSIGHYLRVGLVANVCSIYTSTPLTGCNSNFTEPGGSSAASGRPEPRLARIQQSDGGKQSSAPPTGSLLRDLIGKREDPALARQRRRNLERLRRRADQPSRALRQVEEPMLDYLLGEDK